MLKIAYGEASFDNLKSQGATYIDKTMFIPLMEIHTKFFFIRPRRFGKSLWISVLQAYYDVAKSDKFDTLFDGLYIKDNPTDYKNSYLILKFDFSGINTENEESLKSDFTFRIRRQVISFFKYYKSFFNDVFLGSIEENFKNLSSSQLIARIKDEVKLIDKKLYVLIDEYDHFANKLASDGRESFIKNIMSSAGFVREFYEQLKIASGEGVIERFFITGVSPIMLDELSKDEVFQDMVHYYNGYRFCDEAEKTLFNSDMVLYFLEYFNRRGYPKELLDENVKTDYNKLRGLIIGTSGKEKLQSIIEEINLNSSLSLTLVKRFNFSQRFSDNELKSLLFYLGLLTFSNKPNQFAIPNYVIRTLYWEYLRKFLEESLTIEFDMRLLHNAIYGMAETGDPSGLKELAVDFFQKKLSSYDYTNFSEKHVKFLFVCYFTLSKLYNIISEREISERKRIDLLFEAHPAYYEYVQFNFILEFKYIRKEDSESVALKKKEDAIKQAAEYYEIYKRDFKQFGRGLRSVAMLVSHTRDVEVIEVGGFGENFYKESFF